MEVKYKIFEVDKFRSINAITDSSVSLFVDVNINDYTFCNLFDSEGEAVAAIERHKNDLRGLELVILPIYRIPY